MAIKEIIEKTATKNDLEKVLKSTINEMHKLNVPDAEIMNNIKRLMDNLYDEKSTMRRYKDSVFRKLFDDKKELLSLYNALNNSDYTDPELLEITTLDKYWFISVKNDVAFVIMSELYIVEQQSTICNNMPLRSLFYVTDTYRTMVTYSELYRQTMLNIPEPHFITFYNGSSEMKEDKKIMKLSDAFVRVASGKKDVEYEPELELKVCVYNINKGHNEDMLSKCPTLKEYMEFIDEIRKRKEAGSGLDNAIADAIDYCIDNNILAEFLQKNRDEVMVMLCAEYSLEDYKADMEQYVQELKAQVNEQEEQLADKEEQIAEQKEQLADKDNQLAEKDKEIARLRELLEKPNNQ